MPRPRLATAKRWRQATARHSTTCLRRALAQGAAALARIQHSTIDSRETLLSLGVPDRGLVALPTLYDEMLSDPAVGDSHVDEGLSASERRSLVRLHGNVRQLCRQLASFGVPETLQHDDFHDGNILVDGESLALADWGEAFWTHPFFTLLVTMRSFAYQRRWAADHPELESLRRLYLRAWDAYGKPVELREAANLAERLAMVARARSWYEVTRDLAGGELKEHGGAAPGWLREFLKSES